MQIEKLNRMEISISNLKKQKQEKTEFQKKEQFRQTNVIEEIASNFQTNELY